MWIYFLIGFVTVCAAFAIGAATGYSMANNSWAARCNDCSLGEDTLELEN